MSNDNSDFNIVVLKIKEIIEKRDPNNIRLIDCNFGDKEYNYNNLIEYLQNIEKVDRDSDNELFVYYKTIRDFKNEAVGIFSLFYFKNFNNFLAVGKKDNKLFLFNVRCSQYQDILSRGIKNNNQIYILTYWIF